MDRATSSYITSSGHDRNGKKLVDDIRAYDKFIAASISSAATSKRNVPQRYRSMKGLGQQEKCALVVYAPAQEGVEQRRNLPTARPITQRRIYRCCLRCNWKKTLRKDLHTFQRTSAAKANPQRAVHPLLQGLFHPFS